MKWLYVESFELDRVYVINANTGLPVEMFVLTAVSHGSHSYTIKKFEQARDALQALGQWEKDCGIKDRTDLTATAITLARLDGAYPLLYPED